MRISDWSSDVCSSDLFAKCTPRFPWLALCRVLVRVIDRGAGAGIAHVTANRLPGMDQLQAKPFPNRVGFEPALIRLVRSAERRVGTASVSPWRFRWSPDH